MSTQLPFQFQDPSPLPVQTLSVCWEPRSLHWNTRPLAELANHACLPHSPGRGAGLWGGKIGLPLYDRGPFLTALAFKLPQFGSRTPRLPPRAASKPMGTRGCRETGEGVTEVGGGAVLQKDLRTRTGALLAPAA